jgi:hypothetical protein
MKPETVTGSASGPALPAGSPGDRARPAGEHPRLGSVIELTEGGDAGVVVPGDPPLRLRCDVLRTGDRPSLTLSLGARVLVLLPAPGEERGIVLGVVGPYESPRPDPTPAELRLEAGKRIELACGESSLTMDAEGRVLLKGKDIVTRAKRTQKIRGGTVHIN